MQRRNDTNQKLIETAEGLDPSTMSLSDMVRFIEQFQASAKDTLAKVENAGELGVKLTPEKNLKRFVYAYPFRKEMQDC